MRMAARSAADSRTQKHKADESLDRGARSESIDKYKLKSKAANEPASRGERMLVGSVPVFYNERRALKRDSSNSLEAKTRLHFDDASAKGVLSLAKVRVINIGLDVGKV